MSERSKNLSYSLVGSSIEFRFSTKRGGETTLDGNISSAKFRIRKNVELALSTGGELCVLLLGELTAFYLREIYYMAVRSTIEMRRYRPLVLEHLKLSIEERAKKLKAHLGSVRPEKDKNRDLKIEALRYFLSVYPSRLKEFREVLTREEYIIVA